MLAMNMHMCMYVCICGKKMAAVEAMKGISFAYYEITELIARRVLITMRLNNYNSL